jgi:hypothetical protein
MLGEQIEDLKGKITGQRVIEVEPPTVETSVSCSGTIRGVQVNEILTFAGTPVTSSEVKEGVIHGKGAAIIMAESEIATLTGEGIGTISSSGATRWRGSLFFSTASRGKLAFLNNMIGVFEGEFDAQGNFTNKSWEWK